jgi:hypothetical protein
MSLTFGIAGLYRLKGRGSFMPIFPSTVAIVLAFFVCWAPFHAQRLLFVYVTLFSNWTEKLKMVNDYLFTTAGKRSSKIRNDFQSVSDSGLL